MFCPGCGLEEKQANQFCRACGTDLRLARTGLEKPDTITASAVSARDEIGHAIAAKILETKSTKELAKVTEEVLPYIEKFLESPAEKRLRRMRNGMIVSSIGFGGAIGFSIMNIFLKEDFLVMLAGLSVITFFIGLSFVINGLLLSIPKKACRINRQMLKASANSMSPKQIPTNFFCRKLKISLLPLPNIRHSI